MADPWIKMRPRLCEDPKTGRIARWLTSKGLAVQDSLMARRTAAGCLLEVWGWCHVENRGGLIAGAELEDIDDCLGVPGFGAKMVEVEWVAATKDGLLLTEFARFIGSKQDSAEAARERQRKSREKRDGHSDVTRDSSVTSPNGAVSANRHAEVTSMSRVTSCDSSSSSSFTTDKGASHYLDASFEPPEHITPDFLAEQIQSAEVALSVNTRWEKIELPVRRRALKLGVIQLGPEAPDPMPSPESWKVRLTHHEDTGKKVAKWLTERIDAWLRARREGKGNSGSLNAYLRPAAQWGPDDTGWLPEGTPPREVAP